MYLRCSSVFFVLLQSDNELKGTKFASFMAEFKKGSFKQVTTCYIQYVVRAKESHLRFTISILKGKYKFSITVY